MSVEQRVTTRLASPLPSVLEDRAPGGSVDGICLLSEELLLLIATLPDVPGEAVDILVSANGSWSHVESSLATFEVALSRGAEPTTRSLILLQLGELKVSEVDQVVVRSKSGRVAPEPVVLSRALTSLEALIRERLLPATTPVRAQMLDFLLRSTAGTDRSALKVSQALFLVRESLRERLPSAVIDPSEPRAVVIDAIWRLDERAFYIKGWSRQEGRLQQLTAISPEGECVEIGSTVFRYTRVDVTEFFGADHLAASDDHGFLAYFETQFPSRLSDGWIVQLRESGGGSVEAAAPPTMREPTAARSTILGDLLLEPMQDESLKVGHILPALNRVQHGLIGSVEIDRVDEFGKTPPYAEVSIVVPLYKRLEFVEHQMAQFVHDPELKQVEIIYVLDSPEQADYLRNFALQLYRLYRVPFRLVTLTQNGGFSLANNAGAALGNGRLLLLLNSDVLPEEPGWVGRMTHFYDSTPNIGALGPKLLYEDESLQHAGLYFDRPEGSHVWNNEHYFKGLNRGLPAANVARAVPAVTGACLMISAATYANLGGLRGGFIQGDYEDSDLCLRLAKSGLENWYVPSVVLYHLEGQSYPSEERKLASQFNRWLHSYLWKDEIKRGIERAEVEPKP